MNNGVLILSSIGVLTLACQWFSWWIKLPAILFLLIVGILIGPVFGWFHPDIFFGHLLPPIVSLSVAIILFEGSLTLNFDQIQETRGVVRNLVSIGLLITAILTAVLAHYIVKLSWELSALLGAITAVTGPTVITPILRTVRPNTQISNILRWEGIMIDPIGAILALLVFGFISTVYGYDTLSHIGYHFAELVMIAFICGILFGYGLGVALRRYWIPEFLHNVAALTLVLAAYTISNIINDGSGLLTVTIMGVFLANMKEVPVKDILGFKESLSILLISGLFIILAARIKFTHLTDYLDEAFWLLLLIQFVIRPLSVAICTWRSNLTWQERALLAWIAPRGIVAAATAALFSLRLVILGVEDAQILVLISFLIIIGTVTFQAITARWVANLLKVSEPEPKGFLIVGANTVARAIGNALSQQGYRVLLADLDWEDIKTARMEGLECYYGNPISEHADRHLDLVGIGRLLSLTPQEDLNALAYLRYKSEFGSNNIYTIQTQSLTTATAKHVVASQHRGNILFGKDITYSMLKEGLESGGVIRATTLTEAFGWEAYQAQHGDETILLFTTNPRGEIAFFTPTSHFAFASGWTIVSLIKMNESH